jgi:hypothetical protein
MSYGKLCEECEKVGEKPIYYDGLCPKHPSKQSSVEAMTKATSQAIAEFRECETCAAKPGSPYLCKSCLSNRATIEKLTTVLEEKDKEIEAARKDGREEILKIVPEKKEQLDKNDPDNYGACYAIAGFNDCRARILDAARNLH